MQKITSVRIDQCVSSPTNPRGKVDTSTQAFKDLVASIKQRGVIVPVIARENIKHLGRGPRNEVFFEIVAGNRRLAAAKAAGLEEIPVDIRNVSDHEAMEIQIIENLQREDVHPLEEAQAYRKLVEESKYEVASVAAKVGKSEAYVRQRIFLTRLEAPVTAAYRSGKITDGHAVLVARLSATDQLDALKWLTKWGAPQSVFELKRHIEEVFNKPLEYQPWLKDAEALAAVGTCTTCPPNLPSLFGAVKEGACTDTKCWKKKMSKYIAFRRAHDPKLVLISQEYSYNHNAGDGEILFDNHYTKVGPKNKCQYSVMGLIARGPGLGSQIRICISKECKVHSKRHNPSSRTLSPKEKAKKDKEAAAEKAAYERREKREAQAMEDALKKVKWPVTRKTLNVLLEGALEDHSDMESICTRRSIAPIDKNGYKDEEQMIRKAAEKMSDVELARMLVELAVTNTWTDDTKKKRMQIL